MKKIKLTVALLALTSTLCAQVNDSTQSQQNSYEDLKNNMLKEFEDFARQAYQEYEDFRRQANAEYAKFMAEAWTLVELSPAQDIPWQPKPPRPIIEEEEPVQPTPTPTPDPVSPPKPLPKAEPIPFDVIVTPKEIDKPQPIEPLKPRTVPKAAAQTLYLYGSAFPFYFENERSLKLADLSEKSVADLWTQLSVPYFDDILADCFYQRDQRNLCDWAYIKLTQTVSEKYCGKGTNEAVVMQMYLLTQSGFQMRLGRACDKLVLLIGSSEKIYQYKYFVKDNVQYYNLDRTTQDCSLYVYLHAFPKEKCLSLALTQPKLSVERTEPRTIVSKRYPDVKATVETNRNLLDFYNEYPRSGQWQYYSRASLSDAVKAALYPALRKDINGKNELDAVNILLNFVQTGFEYATDQQQFGYERPFFPDETFFYPYSDCEDRAILFSCLVRELVGLDVVLLHYPGHLAAAVHFNNEVTGDYLTVDGKTYIISDPTFIGAPVGRCAREYKTVKPTVVKI